MIDATAESERFDEHKQTMDALMAAFRSFLVLAACLSDEDVARALKAVGAAESIGFMVDPTRYRQALFDGSLARQRKLLDLFTRTKRDLLEIFPADAALFGQVKS